MKAAATTAPVVFGLCIEDFLAGRWIFSRRGLPPEVEVKEFNHEPHEPHERLVHFSAGKPNNRAAGACFNLILFV